MKRTVLARSKRRLDGLIFDVAYRARGRRSQPLASYLLRGTLLFVPRRDLAFWRSPPKASSRDGTFRGCPLLSFDLRQPQAVPGYTWTFMRSIPFANVRAA